MELVLYDRSRIMAGDRWLVELQCEAHIPIDNSFWELMAGEEPTLASGIRKVLGENLLFATNRKKNFVSAEEREAVLQEMVDQIFSSMLEYLRRPQFPLKLFKKQFHEARQKVLIQQAMSRERE